MTKSIRLDDGTYEKLRKIQDIYSDLTYSQIIDFLIDTKVDMRKIEKKALSQA